MPLLPLFQPVVPLAVKDALRGYALSGPPDNPSQHSEDLWFER